MSERPLLIAVMADPFDGGYVAECIGLPGCMSEGETEAEAIRNIADALEGVREVIAAREDAS